MQQSETAVNSALILLTFHCERKTLEKTSIGKSVTAYSYHSCNTNNIRHSYLFIIIISYLEEGDQNTGFTSRKTKP
jgi:hypothetical protein